MSPGVPVKARGPVVASSSVQQAMQDGNTQTAAPCSHGNLGLPGVSDGVVGLNCCKVGGAVISDVNRRKTTFIMFTNKIIWNWTDNRFFFKFIQNYCISRTISSALL